MNRLQPSRRRRNHGVPRTCGDEPPGWHHALADSGVFPAPAGMNRFTASLRREDGKATHIRKATRAEPRQGDMLVVVTGYWSSLGVGTLLKARPCEGALATAAIFCYGVLTRGIAASYLLAMTGVLGSPGDWSNLLLRRTDQGDCRVVPPRNDGGIEESGRLQQSSATAY